MKKILLIILAIILIIFVLAGCSGNGAEPKSTLGDVPGLWAPYWYVP